MQRKPTFDDLHALFEGRKADLYHLSCGGRILNTGKELTCAELKCKWSRTNSRVMHASLEMVEEWFYVEIINDGVTYELVDCGTYYSLRLKQ